MKCEPAPKNYLSKTSRELLKGFEYVLNVILE
jgi:hypothetical protein